MQITIKEACQLLNISDKTVRNWIDENKLKATVNDKGAALVEKRELLEMHPTILCFFNQKGGSSKTVSTALFADYYENLYKGTGKKILLVDLDPQSSLSQIFFTYKDLYGDDGSNKLTLSNYFENRTPLHKIIRTYNDEIDLLPADIQMAGKGNIDSFQLPKLKEDFLPLFKKYNLVLIDCPPAINAFSRLGLILSNYILCPLLADDNTYRALALAMSTIRDVVKFNTDYIDYRCYLSANRTQKTNIKEFVKEKYRKDLQSYLLANAIPDYVGVVERQSVKENLFTRYPKDKSAIQIKKLIEEVDSFVFEKREIK